MSFESISSSLGLPPAPAMFLGTEWSSEEELGPLGFLSLPNPGDGPPPSPDALYCPDGFELYGFQEEGIRFLLEHPVALLGDEMGLGKSIQAIAAMRLLLHRGEAACALILCPKSLLFDWYYKLRQWAPDLKSLPVEGPKRRRTWYWRSKAHVFLIGYETWREDLKEGLVDPAKFDLLILDEIQRIKNPETATHQSVGKLQPVWRWGLSGTPLENRVEELVAIFSYLKPDIVPHVLRHTPATVRRTVTPYVLRRRKVDVLYNLPPKENRTVWLELTPVQRMAYEAAERAAVSTIKLTGQSAIPMVALALITKLKQICNMDEATGGSAKLAFLEQELERLIAEGEKALLFSQYPIKTLKPLLPRLARFGAALFDGSLTDWNRQIMIHRFQTGDEPRVLAMSLKCGGVGITLTRANHVYHFDHWWNPAVAQQAEDRAHRIGQKKPVYATTLLTRNTIEERIAELVERKRELFRQVMDPLTDFEAGEELSIQKMLSREELMGLFGLH